MMNCTRLNGYTESRENEDVDTVSLQFEMPESLKPATLRRWTQAGRLLRHTETTSSQAVLYAGRLAGQAAISCVCSMIPQRDQVRVFIRSRNHFPLSLSHTLSDYVTTRESRFFFFFTLRSCNSSRVSFFWQFNFPSSILLWFLAPFYSLREKDGSGPSAPSSSSSSSLLWKIDRLRLWPSVLSN